MRREAAAMSPSPLRRRSAKQPAITAVSMRARRQVRVAVTVGTVPPLTGNVTSTVAPSRNCTAGRRSRITEAVGSHFAHDRSAVGESAVLPAP